MNERRLFLADSHIISIMEKYDNDDDEEDSNENENIFGWREDEDDEIYFYK